MKNVLMNMVKNIYILRGIHVNFEFLKTKHMVNWRGLVNTSVKVESHIPKSNPIYCSISTTFHKIRFARVCTMFIINQRVRNVFNTLLSQPV